MNIFSASNRQASLLQLFFDHLPSPNLDFSVDRTISLVEYLHIRKVGNWISVQEGFCNSFWFGLFDQVNKQRCWCGDDGDIGVWNAPPSQLHHPFEYL